MTGNDKVWRAPVAGLASVAMLATLGVSAVTANAAFVPAPTEQKYTVTLDVSGQSGAVLGTTMVNNLKTTTGDSDIDQKTPSSENMELTLNSTDPAKATKATIEDVPANKDLKDLLTTDGSTLIKPANVGTSREFLAWQSAGLAVDIANAKVTSNIEIDGRYAFNGNKVTIKFEGAPSATETVTLVKGDKLADWQVPGIESPAENNQIKGWALSPSATEPMDLSTLDTTKDQTLYPVYGETATITYENVTDDSAASISGEQYVVKGEPFTPTTTATWSGHTFVGWYAAKADLQSGPANYNDLESEPFDFSEGTTENITLYAKFSNDTDYVKVTYKLPASTNLDTTPVPEADYGTDTIAKNTVLSMPPAPSDPTDQGRPFLYWTKTSGATGCNESNRTQYEYVWSKPVTENTLTLYAVFGEPTKTVTKTITFDENWQDGAITTMDANADGSFNTPADPVREGYKFDGWYTNTDDLSTKFDPAKTNYEGTEVFLAKWTKVVEGTAADLLEQITSYPFKTDSSNDASKPEWAVDTTVAGDFTEASWTAFRRAVNGMQKKFDSGLSDEEIADLYAKLLDAESKLVQKADKVASNVYRVYNPNNGDHVYAFNAEAQDLFMLGNMVENPEFSAINGTAHVIPNVSEGVYRVYDPNSGEHLNVDQKEGSDLVALGWQWDNDGAPMFYVPLGAEGVDLYRVYNPFATNAGRHVYGPASEMKGLIALGYVYDYDGEAVYTFSNPVA